MIATMLYIVAKWLFPKLRADQARRRLDTIILVTVFTLGTIGIVLAVMLLKYNQSGR